MNSSQYRRLWVIIVGLIFATSIIVGRLVLFQIVQGKEWAARGAYWQNVNVEARPERGTIYDRNGAVLAANSSDYQIGVSPSLVINAPAAATTLAPILQTPRYDILTRLESKRPFELLSGRVSPAVAEAIRRHELEGIQIDALPRRIYPQEELLCHVLGYTDFDGIGGAGLEGYYQRELAGEAASAWVKISPLSDQTNVVARDGSDLVLTIDRSVQYVVEQHLKRALKEHGALTGTIIVMDPRTGAILAMASEPCYSPYRFFEAQGEQLLNPAVSGQYEPGSVMKLITMAAALDAGIVTPQSTYYDSGVIEIGGIRILNSDRSGPGTTDMTTLLMRSLNVGAATLTVSLGPDAYYSYMKRFGFGQPTGIDLMAEAPGLMPLPGDPLWTESFLGTNSFGQGLAVTPLQMIASVAAIANDGYLMQPYVVEQKRSGDKVYLHEPTILSRPISAQTAHQVSAMAITALAQGAPLSQVPGYTVAGKTGTAQIPENGIYHPTDVIGSIVGWLPADNPEIIILVKLDRPTSAYWGSQTAAPVFSRLASELAVMLNIPPDSIRLQREITAARSMSGN